MIVSRQQDDSVGAAGHRGAQGVDGRANVSAAAAIGNASVVKEKLQSKLAAEANDAGALYSLLEKKHPCMSLGECLTVMSLINLGVLLT
jgi:hypothetical protein